MLEKADNVVLGFVASTTATGAIPIPFADAPLLIGEQVAMMAAINAIFKFDVSKDALKSLAVAALGVGGATVVGKTVATNLIKLVPGAGSVVGGVVSGGTAGVITLALGKAYIEVCKAIKMGKLDQNELTQKAGIEYLKKEFKSQLKKAMSKDDSISGGNDSSTINIQIKRKMESLFSSADDIEWFVSRVKFSLPNISMKTVGGKTFYTNIVSMFGWRVQQHDVPGGKSHYRILDPEDRRRAWVLDPNELLQALEDYEEKFMRTHV